MTHTKIASIYRGVSLSLFVIFILDTLMHFVLVPLDQLTITWISFKGDIDFPTIGIINVFVRLGLYGWLAFFPHRFKQWIPLTLSIMIGTTLYLMVDSWWVFENYVLLYGYWFFLLGGSVLVIYLRQKPNMKRLNWIHALTLFLTLFIAVVYIEIMGWSWPREFIYAYFQRVLYEPILLWLVFTSALVHK